ncbi:helix-turn-helix domain-containing protein [Chryseobacterium gossypii]|uniref:helix-turn-helix domain-containing protein n=1 Tax=Chryseobacterium gossypii TaxID=3231602 RepID=UPI003525C1F5
MQEKTMKPEYRKIYHDLLAVKFPDKLDKYIPLLKRKKELSVLEVLKLNEAIFGKIEKESQKYRSYDKTAILEILEYQKKHRLNNTQLANHFKLSRNTITAWKKKVIISEKMNNDKE